MLGHPRSALVARNVDQSSNELLLFRFPRYTQTDPSATTFSKYDFGHQILAPVLWTAYPYRAKGYTKKHTKHRDSTHSLDSVISSHWPAIVSISRWIDFGHPWLAKFIKMISQRAYARSLLERFDSVDARDTCFALRHCVLREAYSGSAMVKARVRR